MSNISYLLFYFLVALGYIVLIVARIKRGAERNFIHGIVCVVPSSDLLRIHIIVLPNISVIVMDILMVLILTGQRK